MELNHKAVRAKIQKAPSVTNVAACLTLRMSALPMTQYAIIVGKQFLCLTGKAVCIIKENKNVHQLFLTFDADPWNAKDDTMQ